jgi:putative FmdB family regulatory protein
MPLYEYKCSACGKRFEKIRKFSDPPLKKCDLCGKGPITKLISAPGIQFKGAGWYITDYAKGSSSAAGSDRSVAPESSSSDEGSKSDTSDKSESSDPKSETKSDTKSAKSDSKPAKSKAKAK